MAVVDDLAVSAHHVVWGQTDIQERRVVQSLPGVQVDGGLVLTVSRWEVKSPFYTCEETEASKSLSSGQASSHKGVCPDDTHMQTHPLV